MDSGVYSRLSLVSPIAVAGLLILDLTWRTTSTIPSGIERTERLALVVLACLSAAATLMRYRSDAITRGGGLKSASRGNRPAYAIDPTLPLIFHEIKNYAITMKGNTTLLRSHMAGGVAHPSLERLERATERIEKLSREVMDVSLMGRPSESHPVDMVALVKSTAEGYFQGFDLSFSIKADKAVFHVHGEARKLEQVFLNLFKNAIEAGAKRIGITLLAQPGKVGLLIEDDGKGCTPEQIEKMFDAYQSFKRSQGGSGLGLFLVKAIVEGHQGTISGFSKNQKAQSGNGMVFVLQFPLVPENQLDSVSH